MTLVTPGPEGGGAVDRGPASGRGEGAGRGVTGAVAAGPGADAGGGPAEAGPPPSPPRPQGRSNTRIVPLPWQVMAMWVLPSPT